MLRIVDFGTPTLFLRVPLELLRERRLDKEVDPAALVDCHDLIFQRLPDDVRDIPVRREKHLEISGFPVPEGLDILAREEAIRRQ